MSIQHYDGYMGKFDYDDTVFTPIQIHKYKPSGFYVDLEPEEVMIHKGNVAKEDYPDGFKGDMFKVNDSNDVRDLFDNIDIFPTDGVEYELTEREYDEYVERCYVEMMENVKASISDFIPMDTGKPFTLYNVPASMIENVTENNVAFGGKVETKQYLTFNIGDQLGLIPIVDDGSKFGAKVSENKLFKNHVNIKFNSDEPRFVCADTKICPSSLRDIVIAEHNKEIYGDEEHKETQLGD